MSFPWAKAASAPYLGAHIHTEAPGENAAFFSVARQTPLLGKPSEGAKPAWEGVFGDGVPVGTKVRSDEEQWSSDSAGFYAHVIVPVPAGCRLSQQDGCVDFNGHLSGWVPYEALTRCSASFAPIPKLPQVSLKEARIVQSEYEAGYRQLPVQQAIAAALASRKGQEAKVTIRDACDPVWLKVRGPMLIRRGYPPTEAGMAEFETIPREYTVDGKHTSKPKDDLPKEELIALVSTNKRVVALMNNMDPAKAINPFTGKPAVEGAAPPQFERPRPPAPPPTGPVKEGKAWTLAELKDIRMDCFAEDVPIDLAKMRMWPLEKVTEYFEEGG